HDARSLMTRDADDDGPSLVHGQVRGIVARVAARAEDVELREGLPGWRREDYVGQGAACDGDACGEGNCQPLLDRVGVLPLWRTEVHCKGKASVWRQLRPPQNRRIAHADSKEGNCCDDGRETDSQGSEVQK